MASDLGAAELYLSDILKVSDTFAGKKIKKMAKEKVQKRFTILHSNDIHGDFQAEVVDGKPGKMVGRLALLSGYIKTRPIAFVYKNIITKIPNKN